MDRTATASSTYWIPDKFYNNTSLDKFYIMKSPYQNSVFVFSGDGGRGGGSGGFIVKQNTKLTETG